MGNQNKQTSDSKPPLVNSFTKLLNFWSTESESISKLVPSADDFNKRVIQHSQHFLDKLESSTFDEELLDNTVTLILDQMAILLSRLTLVEIQDSADTTTLQRILSKLLYYIIKL